jgi:uncharacterized membrane protein
MGGYDMTGWAWFAMLMMVIITVAIIGGVLWIAARSHRPGDPPPLRLSAREQLDTRLAQGEIDTQEYRERLEALSGHNPSA